MLDLKTVTMKKFQPVLGMTTPINCKKISHLFGTITDPVVYTSFMLQVCQMIKAKKPHKLTYVEILEEITTRANEIGTSRITQEQFADSIELYEAYNNAVPIMMRAKKNHDMALPFTTFQDLQSHMTALEFVMGFEKMSYPLVTGWEEFIVSLPDFLKSKGQDRALVKFGSYFYFVKSGDFNRWYARTKSYGGAMGAYVNWLDAYRDEVRGYSDEKLQEEVEIGCWGRVVLEREKERRKKEMVHA